MDGDRPDVIMIDAAGRIVDNSVRLFQEELELARIEIVDKLPRLGMHTVKLVGALVLGLVGAVLLAFGIGFLLGQEVFDNLWAGFLILAVLVLLPSALLAAGALRGLRDTGPPLPTAAIKQADQLSKIGRTVRR